MNDRIAAALALGLAATTVQSAESFPARPIRVVVAAAAGGGSDFVGRVVSQKVSDALGLPR
jgi:tripartite-type tricarboxylate transporter receptor subunit TctC